MLNLVGTLPGIRPPTRPSSADTNDRASNRAAAPSNVSRVARDPERARIEVAEPELRGSVLLVDDEPEILTNLRAFIERRYPHVVVHCAPDAAHALDALRALDPDVIVSDHMMPGMDGITFLSEASARRPGSFRILQTGWADMTLAIRAINEGHVQAFIEKPMASDEIAQVIRKGIRDSTRRRAVSPDRIPEQGTVLVVDRDAELCAAITQHFQLYHPRIRVVHAACANDAFARLADGSVDVILSDYRLPDMTGMEFLDEARRASPTTRTILITGDPTTGLARAASDSLAIDRFFIKPVEMVAFARAVRMLLPREPRRADS